MMLFVLVVCLFGKAEDGIRDECVIGFFLQAEDGIRVLIVTGVQTCVFGSCVQKPVQKFFQISSAWRIDVNFGKWKFQLLKTDSDES